MIVVDASAAISALLNDGPARHALATEPLHVPHLVDSEVASGLRRMALAGAVTPDAAWKLLDAWRRQGMTRYPIYAMLDRVWQLRDNLSAYDAGYVALAEVLDCRLLTGDRRLAGAPGIRCPVTVLPH